MPVTGPESRPPLESLFAPDDERSDKVCYCMHVHEVTLRRAIAQGAKTVAELGELTRAGTGCGTCRVDLIRLLEEEGQKP